jgi:hypothetical protein
MSFIGDPYATDIFISYSHGDSGDGGPETYYKRWSRHFWKALDRQLRSYPDLAGIRTFFDDNKRQGGGLALFDSIDPALQESVSRSAILLALVSQQYLKSEYCRREREWWHSGQGELGHDPRRRLAPIIMWGDPPAGAGNWFEALKGTELENILSASLYDKEQARDRPHPYGWPGIGEEIEDRRFHDAVLEVSIQLRRQLRDFKETVDLHKAHSQSGSNVDVASGEKPTVYLHGRSDAADEWDRAQTALTEAGFPVLPMQPEPIVTDAAERRRTRDERVRTMATCDALLMLAPHDPVVFAEELKMLGKADRDLATARAEELGILGKSLPGAVVDMTKDPSQAQRRKLFAKNFRLDWFSHEDPAWVGQATNWLGSVA